MLKRELRRQFIDRRKTLPDAEIARLSAAVADRFFRRFDLSNVRRLHTFLPIERLREIDTRLITARLAEEHPQIETIAPRMDEATGELVHLRFDAATELVVNAWRIEEPAGADFVAESELDLVLVPLLCCDLRGYRVGYGKGFYDRFLAKCRADCRKIGLGYFPPVEKIEDVHEADVRLDFCVTPEEICDFRFANCD